MMSCPRANYLLVLPRLHIQNANAVSSPLTHGFPSMTAFLGLLWALQRKLAATGLDVKLKAIAAVCHDHQEQVTEGGYVHAFRLTRNPVDKDGSTAAIVEEGRIHLELSLVLALDSERWLRNPDCQNDEAKVIAEQLSAMRVAGGSVRPPTQRGRRRYHPHVVDLSGSADDRQAQFRKARMRLLPGFALVLRDDRLETRLTELRVNDPATSRLDAWLSLSRINWRHQASATTGKGEWVNDRTGQGWIVPIPVGYGALSEVHAAGSVANTRDTRTPFRFVESLYSVGQWISPHRLLTPEQLLWYADSQPDQGLYRCRNDYHTAAEPLFDPD
jgi:CRISPR-associated protein Csy2